MVEARDEARVGIIFLVSLMCSYYKFSLREYVAVVVGILVLRVRRVDEWNEEIGRAHV